jgi:acyl-CoA synthetase (AMP-forming)/AMP-acid ligase II
LKNSSNNIGVNSVIDLKGRFMQVSVVAPNIPALYEMHFAVPMAGAVLNTVNIRLDARAMALQFRHCEPKFVFVDYQYMSVVVETN